MLFGHIFKVSASIGVISVKHMVISTYSYRLQIEEYLNKRIKKLNLKEYQPIINVEEKGKTTFVTCSFPLDISKSQGEGYFKEYIIIPVAKAIVDIIQKEFAVDYANEILQTSYGFREIMITEIVENKLETKKLLHPIINEITQNNAFCIDGWIRFRLSQYKMFLIDMVENLTYEYEAYKEYKEFITLIKYFVLNQQSLMDQIHIIPDKNGSIDLYNEKKESVTLNREQYDCQDDLILGTLLTLAPSSMMIHQEEKCNNIRLMDTIKNIYEGRIIFCNSCQHCEREGFKVGIFRALKDILTQKKL